MAVNVLPASTRHVWVVRAGRAAIHAGRFLEEGRVAIGFGLATSVGGLSWDEVLDAIRKLMPDDTRGAQGAAAGALYRIANEIAIGDIVLTPEPGGTILAGEVLSAYEFLNEPIAEDYRHTRSIRWFGRVVRTSLPKHMLGTLGAIATFFQPGFQQDLLDLLQPMQAGPVPPPIAIAPPPPPPPTLQIPIPTNPVPLAADATSEFETDKLKLLYLLEQVKNRDLALPDFQRSFVWDAAATRELLVSVIRGFPAGHLLFLKGGSNVFVPRAVEEAPSLNGHQPAGLILDGQQRLTSLYQALHGVGSHRFYVNIAALMTGAEIDDAVVAYSRARAREFESRATQAKLLLFPFSAIHEYLEWRDEVLDARREDDEDSRKRLRGYLATIDKAIVQPIKDYQFPATSLSAKTPTEAVCTIFETLNRTGIKLSVFELITARAFAAGMSLRDRWQETLAAHPILEEFGIDPYYILQTVALRLGKKPQRGFVVSMRVDDIAGQWDDAARGMAGALSMLRDECGVLTAKWLPYATMLMPLATSWRSVEKKAGPQIGQARLKLQRWFWCTAFEGEYDSAANSKAEADAPALERWIDDGDLPPVVRNFNFPKERWLAVTSRQRALYASTIALLNVHRPLDFHQVVPLTRNIIETTAVDDHHVFPAGYLRDEGVTGYVDTVLNHTLIDKQPNIRISKKAPSVYLNEMRDELGSKIDDILESHSLPADPAGPLLTNDYDNFLEWRMNRLSEQLRRVTSGG